MSDLDQEKTENLDQDEIEIRDALRRALPHDFGSTLSFLDKNLIILRKNIKLLGSKTNGIKFEKRLDDIKKAIDKIDNEFADFWDEYEELDDLIAIEKDFRSIFDPIFNEIIETSVKVSELLHEIVQPRVLKSRSSRYNKIYSLAVKTSDRIIYHSRRSLYYITGMSELIGTNEAKRSDSIRLENIVRNQKEILLFRKQKSVSVNIEILNKLPTIKAGYGHITRLFYNIIKNSIKYRKGNVARICILYDTGFNLSRSQKNKLPKYVPVLEGDGKFFALHFFDYGIGVDRELLDAIFRPFKRGIDHELEQEIDERDKREFSSGLLSSNNRYTGMGIGLAVVRRVASLYGGQAYASSSKGLGTCITCVLPVELVTNT